MPSGTAVAALAYLREETLPQVMAAPEFVPRPRAATEPPAWLDGLRKQIARRAMLLAVLAAVIAIAIVAVPAAASLQQGSAPAAGPRPAASAITGSAATRVEDLSVASFVGGLPFLQRSQFLSARAAAPAAPAQFITTAREAAIIEYIGGVTGEIALPALNDAIATKYALDRWNTAIADALRAEAARARSAHVHPVAGAAITPGTRIANTFVTFYACVGNGFCGNMANGQRVFAGAAACSTNLPFGTRFFIEGDPTARTYVCLDRGVPGPTWVDVWFYDVADGWVWQAALGRTRGEIVIVE